MKFEYTPETGTLYIELEKNKDLYAEKRSRRGWHMKITIGIVFVFGLFVSAFSQSSQPPNDVDLKAAYCLASYKSVDSSVIATASLIHDTNAAAIKENNTVLDYLNSRIQHLQLYLLPRMSYVDNLGIAAAMQSEKLDEQETKKCNDRCWETFGSCDNDCRNIVDVKKRNICSNKCLFVRDSTCFKNCSAMTLEKIKPCATLSFLPY